MMKDVLGARMVEAGAVDWPALVTAARNLVAERGLRGLSLRAVAGASGWTMGEIGYRVGKKEQLIALLLEAERAASDAADHRWIDRLSSVPSFSGATLAAVVSGYLDDTAINRREAAIFWEELLLEAGIDPSLHALVAPWIEERERFWRQLLINRHPKAEALARVIVKYVVGEQLYSVVLGADPSYRLMRDMGIRRLCGGILADAQAVESDLFDHLIDMLAPTEPIANFTKSSAWPVAQTTATLMRDRGLSAITHRSVAAALGVSPSAVAHHFRTHMDLVRAGNEALYEGFRENLDLDGVRRRLLPDPKEHGGAIGHQNAAVGLSRATHMIALAGARDPAFAPLVARRRKDRGQSTSLWGAALFAHPERYDRCAAQVTSMVLGGDLFLAMARGIASTGRLSAVMNDFVELAS